ncbi:MAG: AI-2E family transporter [Ahniella sp.]|nr:AI-2E family transporter [Ahniella sp.]
MAEPLELEELDVKAEHPTRNRLLAAMLTLMVLYTCALASSIIVPMLLALLISLMLAPAVRFLCGWHLPRVVATLLVLIMVAVVVLGLLAAMIDPAREWISGAPKAIDRLELALRELGRPLAAAAKATEELAALTTSVGGARSQRVMEVGSGHMAQMLSFAPAVATSFGVTLLLTFVFLLHGDGLLRKFVALAPELRFKKDIVQASRDVQHELSVYMLTITTINAVLGLCVAGCLWWMGVEHPLLWGGVAAILNYAPYAGPALVTIALTVVGFSTFDTPLAAFSVPGMFLILNTIEGELLMPMVVGRRLALDPVVVFLALVTLGWLWGMAGLLLALPLLTCVRIVADRVPSWAPLAKLLGAGFAVRQ